VFEIFIRLSGYPRIIGGLALRCTRTLPEPTGYGSGSPGIWVFFLGTSVISKFCGKGSDGIVEGTGVFWRSVEFGGGSIGKACKSVRVTMGNVPRAF
jgi:hypothetical protein